MCKHRQSLSKYITHAFTYIHTCSSKQIHLDIYTYGTYVCQLKSVRMFMHVCMPACGCERVCVFVSAWECVSVGMSMSVFASVCVCECVCVCVRAWVCMCMCMCVCCAPDCVQVYECVSEKVCMCVRESERVSE